MRYRFIQQLFVLCVLPALALSFCVTPVSAAEGLDGQLEKAVAAEARGDYEAARKIYTQATQEHPASAEAWAALGEHLRFYAHDAAAATVAFNSALAVKSPAPRAAAFAWRGLGELAAKEGRDAVAVDYFKRSAEALPLADTYRSMCHLYCRQRKFTEAAAAAGEAVKLSPDDDIARLLYAAQLHRAGEKEQGRKEFDAVAAAHGITAEGAVKRPIHCCVLYNAAGYLSVCGEQDHALKMLQNFFETPNHRHLTREEIETDADFEELKKLPAFGKLLDHNFSGDASRQSPRSDSIK